MSMLTAGCLCCSPETSSPGDLHAGPGCAPDTLPCSRQQATILRQIEAGLVSCRARHICVPVLLQLLEGSKHCMPVAASQLNCLGDVLRELGEFGVLDCCLLLLLKLLRWGRLLCIQPCLVL